MKKIIFLESANVYSTLIKLLQDYSYSLAFLTPSEITQEISGQEVIFLGESISGDIPASKFVSIKGMGVEQIIEEINLLSC